MLSTIGSVASQDNLLTWDKYDTKYTNSPSWYLSSDWEYPQNIEFYTYPAIKWVVNKFVVDGVRDKVHNFYESYNISWNCDDDTGKCFGYTMYRYYYSNGRLRTFYAEGNRVGNPYLVKNNLVQANVRASLDTYPNDGLHTDGYWYVKKV